MFGQEPHDLERKVTSILKVLKDSPKPVGARLIAHQLRDYGICLSERAVRYHLKLMDERGLTYLVSKRQGRLVTQSGLNELSCALVGDRVGSAMTKIETLICQTSFKLTKREGMVPINVSLFPIEQFDQALEVMRASLDTNICIGELVAVASEGEKLGETYIPRGKVGFATLSNIMVVAAFFEAGIPLDFKFAGVLQIRNHDCLRFIELIEYTGTSLNPYVVFLSGKMTAVGNTYKDGNGKILASFCELPALALPKVEAVIKKLESTRINGVAKLGGINEPLCETPVGIGKFGMVLADGLNLVAATAEAGIEVENHPSSSVIDFAKLGLLKDFRR